MGADIHGVVELQLASGCVGVNHLDIGRNYAAFADLASVRGDGKHEAYGMPADASPLAKLMFGQDMGYHHLSHLPITEFIGICCMHGLQVGPYDLLPYELLDMSADARVVFWFDS